jgi:hypothetical protein
MLKTRRIEYTLAYFRNQGQPKTIKDYADITFVDEMRYQATRLVGISYILGLNAALASYCLVFSRLRWYVSLPLTFAVGFVSRNLVMKYCMDKIYYPI